MRGRRGLVSYVVRVWGLRRIYSTVLDWDSLQISHDVLGASAVKHEDSPRLQFYLVDCLPSWILLEYFSVLKLTLRPETVRQHPTRCPGDCQHQDLRLQPTVANARRGAQRVFDAEALPLKSIVRSRILGHDNLIQIWTVLLDLHQIRPHIWDHYMVSTCLDIHTYIHTYIHAHRRTCKRVSVRRTMHLHPYIHAYNRGPASGSTV